MSILPSRLLIMNDVRLFAIEHLRLFLESNGRKKTMRMMTMTIEPKPQSVEEQATGL